MNTNKIELIEVFNHPTHGVGCVEFSDFKNIEKYEFGVILKSNDDINYIIDFRKLNRPIPTIIDNSYVFIVSEKQFEKNIVNNFLNIKKLADENLKILNFLKQNKNLSEDFEIRLATASFSKFNFTIDDIIEAVRESKNFNV